MSIEFSNCRSGVPDVEQAKKQVFKWMVASGVHPSYVEVTRGDWLAGTFLLSEFFLNFEELVAFHDRDYIAEIEPVDDCIMCIVSPNLSDSWRSHVKTVVIRYF